MDKMKELCEYLDIPMDDIMAGYVSDTDEKYMKSLFWEDEKLFYQIVETIENKYESILYLYVKWAAESYQDYKKAGFSDEIYFNNYYDLGIWYRTCLEQTGRRGIKEYQWTALPIKKRIFRLGRLQFEPSNLREDVIVDGHVYKKNTKMLEVHIPEGETLTPEKVKKSFEWSKEFFKKEFYYEYEIYYCESWLLSPHLKEILSKQSNILDFQKRFYIYKELKSKQAEQRVFRCEKENPIEYPEKTSLQRNLKKYLLSGQTIGMGYGIIKRE